MLPKTGRKLPVWKGVLGSRDMLAQTIGDLLRKEHGGTRQTRANVR
jgi:hypothetical protein